MAAIGGGRAPRALQLRALELEGRGELDRLYLEQLQWFKENERPEAVLTIAGNSTRTGVALAWTTLEVAIADDLTPPRCQSEHGTWEWLWENSSFSWSELPRSIGAPYSERVLERKTEPLIRNRVLYPDGTTNSFVQRYLRECVVKLFDTTQGHHRRAGQGRTD